MLELRNIDIRFGDLEVFTNLSHRFPDASITCIETGVLDGGSTFLKCCGGVIEPTSGEVLLDGKVVSSMSENDIFNDLCYCYESGGLVSIFTVYNNIALPIIYHGKFREHEIRDKVEVIAEQLDILPLLEQEPHQLNDVQTRLVNLLRALVNKPKVLLVDELQSGMSPEMRSLILNVLLQHQREAGFTLIMTTTAGDEHDFADFRYKIIDKHLVETT